MKSLPVGTVAGSCLRVAADDAEHAVAVAAIPHQPQHDGFTEHRVVAAAVGAHARAAARAWSRSAMYAPTMSRVMSATAKPPAAEKPRWTRMQRTGAGCCR